MLKFLKRLFETPKGDYGSLMDSRDPEVELFQSTINTIVEALRPILLPAMHIEKSNVDNDKFRYYLRETRGLPIRKINH